jgi:tryptophan synthase beta chain
VRHEGHFGNYGGQFVPETLMYPLEELEAAYQDAQQDPSFHAELEHLFHNYSGVRTPFISAEGLTEAWGGAKIYLKREDLNHTGANTTVLVKVPLARRMGKKRIIAETGAASARRGDCDDFARLGLECDVYMGEEDIPPAGTECLSHETARRARHSRVRGKQDFKGRD